jgi:hypothetical protein
MYKRFVCLSALALATAEMFPSSAQAANPGMLGQPDCQFALLERAPANASVNWSGSCLDGYASGKGVLSWRSEKFDKHSIEATLVRGAITGEAILRTPRYTYTGTLNNGVPHGQGFFEYANNDGWYEGQVAEGVPHGKGVRLAVDRSRYTGDWVNGERNGLGEATFSTGGSYTGSWRNDKFDGQGKIVYAGSRRIYEGLFADGRVAGVAAPDLSAQRYALKEMRTGTQIRKEGAVGNFPPNANWNTLTDAQKNTMRSYYPALEAGDDPPFPLQGQGYLLEMLTRVNNPVVERGLITVDVLIGKDGKATNVTSYGEPSKELVRIVSHLAVSQQYKPAMCQGVPCEMVYPIRINFSVDL